MWSSQNRTKNNLKVKLGLAKARLKIQESKKTQLNLRARPEIAEYVKISKTDRARFYFLYYFRVLIKVDTPPGQLDYFEILEETQVN